MRDLTVSLENRPGALAELNTASFQKRAIRVYEKSGLPF